MDQVDYARNRYGASPARYDPYVRDDGGRVTLTAAESAMLRVVVDAGNDGALLAAATRPKLGQVESKAARRLARQGLLTIDAGGAATLTDQGRALLA